MNNRIKAIVNYKTNGKQKMFAELMGWSPAYLGKLLAGNNIGLQPVLAILRAMPEIDARWLLFGEGSMIADQTARMREKTISHIREVLAIEPYVAVMTPAELAIYERMVTTGASHDFSNESRMRWMSETARRQMEVDIKVRQAMDTAYADE